MSTGKRDAALIFDGRRIMSIKENAMNRMLMPVIALGGMVAASAVAAQEPAPGRYAMQKTDSGIARLDTQTGEVSLCQEKDGDIVCRMAADERTAFELELDLLTKRVETLEKAASDGTLGIKPRLPTKEEIDQTMGVMERMMRSFMGIVKDLESGNKPPSDKTEDMPQKT
jgi:exonuclease VII small subunit